MEQSKKANASFIGRHQARDLQMTPEFLLYNDHIISLGPGFAGNRNE